MDGMDSMDSKAVDRMDNSQNGRIEDLLPDPPRQRGGSPFSPVDGGS
jgi:hypothetical protein